MKRVMASVFVLLSSGILIAADEKVSDDDSKSEIVFPDKAKELPGKGQKQWLLEREGGKAVLMLQVNSFDKALDIGNADAVKFVMDSGRGALTKALKGAKLISEKDVKFGKFPARDVDVDAPGLGIYRVKFILTGDRFFQLTVPGPKDYVDGAEAKKFFESFKLKD